MRLSTHSDLNSVISNWRMCFWMLHRWLMGTRRFWVCLFYWIFSVAVMTRAFPDAFWTRRDLVLLQEISSYLLLACGVTYVISVKDVLTLNIFCIRFFGDFLIYAVQNKEFLLSACFRNNINWCQFELSWKNFFGIIVWVCSNWSLEVFVKL